MGGSPYTSPTISNPIIPAGPTGPTGPGGSFITPALQATTSDDVTGLYDVDTPVMGVDYGTALPAGDYTVVGWGTMVVQIGPTAPGTLGFDLIDGGGHDLWTLTTILVPPAIVTDNALITVPVSSSSNFTVTSEQSAEAFAGPSWQVFPTNQDVTVKAGSTGVFMIFPRAF